MNQTIRPKTIEDIIDNLNVYLGEIRKMSNVERIGTIEILDRFVKQYFEKSDIGRAELIPIAASLIDKLYKAIVNMPCFDINTSGYLGIVVNRIFFDLSQKGINLFYVVDNSLRDDKFALAKALFKNSGLDVVTPNSLAAENTFDIFSDTKPVYTKGDNLDFKTVENQIVESITNKRHIVYIERDDGVNYLSNILKLAEEFQANYICVFRNKGVDDPTPPQVFMGSFGDILD